MLRRIFHHDQIQPHTWKQPKRWSSCSGEKSHANLANKSWTFFTIASCLPHWAAHTASKSSNVKAFSLMMNRRIFSNFSTYWGWCSESRRTISNTLFSLIHFYKMKEKSWNYADILHTHREKNTICLPPSFLMSAILRYHDPYYYVYLENKIYPRSTCLLHLTRSFYR